MGIVEKLKRITNWESAVVIMFFLGCCTAIVITGSFVASDIMIIGGLVALGIPTSFLGNIGQRVAQPITNSTSTSTLTDDKTLALAQMKVRMADLESKLELMNIVQDIEKVCGDEEP